MWFLNAATDVALAGAPEAFRAVSVPPVVYLAGVLAPSIHIIESVPLKLYFSKR